MPAPHVDSGAATRLRAALEASGLTEEAMHHALGVDPGASRTSFDVSVFDRRLSEPTRLNTLLRVFVLGLPVSSSDAKNAFDPLPLADAESLRLITVMGDVVRRDLSLSLVRGMWFFHDRAAEDPERPDHVLGPGPASRTLSALTVRREVDAALDLGTGCGIQAVLTAAHADRVVATDTNERALFCTELNAGVNGIGTVEVRRGSLFDPIDGESFDLIVSNPPFVISPESRIEYRDSDLPGDAISSTVVRGAGQRLNPGGFATLLCNWIVRDGEEWAEPPTRWVEGLGCDAWLIESDLQDPLAYAATWVTSTPDSDYGAAIDRWVDYHRSLGAAAIATGAVVLRSRAEGRPWIRTDHLPTASDAAGDHILRLFANRDFLDGARDEDLMATRFERPPALRVDQTFAPDPGGWVAEESVLRVAGGVGFTGRTDPSVLRILAGCDGTRTLGELVRETAATLRIEVDVVGPEVAGVVRQMLSLGFLEARTG